MHYLKPKQIKVANITTSEVELKDLLKAWLAISFAFAILFSGGLSFSFGFYYVFIVSSLTVGIGFLFHEIAHKLTAQHYGCFAEFRSFDTMLILAVLMSFLGFIFAAPGAVMISGPVGKRRNGRISMAGPLTNIILSLLFFSLMSVPVPSLLKPVLFIGFFINSLLALFNMIPIGNFDGRKVLIWNKFVYGTMAAASVILFFISMQFYRAYATMGVL
jgi:Zn-dependent protease|tara:strand:- start:525 stop:1175 length:651 start_codon:yes stop_codon:yes gene_type:complete